MSNTKTEAQRLADWLDGFQPDRKASVHHECAAELRRLDAENQQLRTQLAKAAAEELEAFIDIVAMHGGSIQSQEPVTLRNAFEARMTDNGKWPRAVEQGRNGCYLLAQTENAWVEWQACAEALATTEPEPTGMPELPGADVFFEDGKDQYGYAEYGHAFSFQCTKAYGEQCWKAGYKHGAWGDKPEPTSKQSLQVEPAVNQQLTTELDEREAFTDDTKDALMAGRAYAQEALIRFDDAYDRHPSTEPDRNAILTDIQLIDAAMADGVRFEFGQKGAL